MIEAILHAAKYGGDQAIAGPRGDGKTRSALFVALMLELAGAVVFPLVISKSSRRATLELNNLKGAVRDSRLFAADFPEIAVPIADLGGWASRARQQTAHGQPTHMEWGQDVIIFPTISTDTLLANGWPGGVESAACGQAMASLGVEGPIRGLSIRNRRPDLAIIDDVDDRESASSETQTETRERIIEEDIGGLAGPDKTIARVMLCTLVNRTCIAATYTDREKKPSWRGQRHKLLEARPDSEDRWDEYLSLRSGRGLDDPDARVAHRFYLDNREAMDAGAVVTNQLRFDSRLAADGEAKEVSALQACYNLIADRGWDRFATEYQNDPPDDEGLVESGITSRRIQKQVNGLSREVVPPTCAVLTRGIDCGKRELHYVTRAWDSSGTGYTIDYGVVYVALKDHSEEGVDLAISRTLASFLDESRNAYGRTIDRTLVDARYRPKAVIAACLDYGLGVMPIEGYGKTRGCLGAHLSIPSHKTADVTPGDNWVIKRRAKGIRVVQALVDPWKAWEHDRWLTMPGMVGCMTLWGTPHEEKSRLSPDEFDHKAYAAQIVSEVEAEEPYRGIIRRVWRVKDKRNHYLDASVYANIAASMEGIRLGGQAHGAMAVGRRRIPPPEQRQSLQQMAKG